MNPIGNPAVGRKRLARAEESQEVGAPHRGQSANYSVRRSQAIADHPCGEKTGRNDEDFEHVPILAFRAVLRLAVDRKALKLRSTT